MLALELLSTLALSFRVDFDAQMRAALRGANVPVASTPPPVREVAEVQSAHPSHLAQLCDLAVIACVTLINKIPVIATRRIATRRVTCNRSAAAAAVASTGSCAVHLFFH